MKKEPRNPKRTADPWRSNLDATNANRARLTALLREQRLKRDAEIAATGAPVTPAKRAGKQKAGP